MLLDLVLLSQIEVDSDDIDHACADFQTTTLKKARTGIGPFLALVTSFPHCIPGGDVDLINQMDHD